ncbi:MAG: putative peptidoglycan binding protein [Crocinitomicaceae bacterium]|jgi:N-acetyl-anhydromuramyl-L-alanine amidase AmpD|nr:putative peptidoglycan binding protein [Crocinitomicaceae bacterium]
MSELDVSKIKQVKLKPTQYFEEEVPKTQIYLHHTAGNASGVNVAQDWANDDRGRIATAFVISGPGATNSADGEIIQCFSSRHWGYHLGVKTDVFSAYNVPYRVLDKTSVGIETCNWGQLTLKNGKYYNYVNKEVRPEFVTELTEPFKGFKYYHKYSDAQIESLRKLIIYLGKTYKINLKFDYDQMFKVSTKALKGENGMYSHNSVRKDKVDVYPCPRLIAMLKSIQV